MHTKIFIYYDCKQVINLIDFSKVLGDLFSQILNRKIDSPQSLPIIQSLRNYNTTYSNHVSFHFEIIFGTSNKLEPKKKNRLRCLAAEKIHEKKKEREKKIKWERLWWGFCICPRRVRRIMIVTVHTIILIFVPK